MQNRLEQNSSIREDKNKVNKLSTSKSTLQTSKNHYKSKSLFIHLNMLKVALVKQFPASNK